MKNYMSFPFGVFFRTRVSVWHRPHRWSIHRIFFPFLIYSEYDWFCALIIHITQRKKEKKAKQTLARPLRKCKCKRDQTWHVCEFKPNALFENFDIFRHNAARSAISREKYFVHTMHSQHIMTVYEFQCCAAIANIFVVKFYENCSFFSLYSSFLAF